MIPNKLQNILLVSILFFLFHFLFFNYNCATIVSETITLRHKHITSASPLKNKEDMKEDKRQPPSTSPFLASSLKDNNFFFSCSRRKQRGAEYKSWKPMFYKYILANRRRIHANNMMKENCKESEGERERRRKGEKSECLYMCLYMYVCLYLHVVWLLICL